MNRNVPAVPKPGPLPTLVRTGEWTLELPFIVQLSLNDRQHWALKAKHVKEWRDAAHVLAKHARIPSCRRVLVELHYLPRTNQRRDPDNLVASLKPLVDGLVDAGVVADDTADFVDRQWPVIHPATGQPSRFYLRVVAL